MSNRHALKLGGGGIGSGGGCLLSDWLTDDTRGLCLVSGADSSGHVAFLAELCSHWLPPRAPLTANQRRGRASAAAPRLHWVSTLVAEDAARAALQKFGARREAATFSSVRDILLSHNERGGIDDEQQLLDRLLEHLVSRFEAVAAIDGCDRPILVVEDLSPLIYVGCSPAGVTHTLMRLCQLTRIGRADDARGAGLIAIGAHASQSDAVIGALLGSLKSLAAFVLTAEPLESGYLAEVDGRVTLSGPPVASDANNASCCLGRWRSAQYHYFVTDRQVKCFPIGLSEFAAS